MARLRVGYSTQVPQVPRAGMCVDVALQVILKNPNSSPTRIPVFPNFFPHLHLLFHFHILQKFSFEKKQLRKKEKKP